MKKILLVISLAITVLLLQACSATPANTYEYIIDGSYNEFITMGTSADYEPFEWPITKDGKTTLVGIDIEIAKEIAKSQRKNLRVIDQNFDYLIQDLSTGKLDFVMAGMTITEERLEKVSFSDFYYEAEDVLVVQKKNESIYTSIDVLNVSGKKIGAQSGTVQTETVDELFNNSVKQYLPNMVNLINDLRTSKLDGLVLDRPVAESYISRFSDIVISEAEFPVKEDKFAVAVNKGSTKLLKDINTTIAELHENGKLQEFFTMDFEDGVINQGGISFKFLFNKQFIGILLKGLAMTIVLSLISVIFGAILGIIPALGRLSNSKWLKYPATAYVEIIRGTPLLVLIFLMYAFINLPVTVIFGVDMSSFIPGVLALMVNSSAYVAELIRGGINSIDPGQKEAALSLGLNERQAMTKVIFPQAIKNIIPSLGNEFVSMIKETSIFINLGVAELMYSATLIINQTYSVKEVYLVVAVLYMILTIPTSQLMGYLERRLKKNEK